MRLRRTIECDGDGYRLSAFCDWRDDSPPFSCIVIVDSKRMAQDQYLWRQMQRCIEEQIIEATIGLMPAEIQVPELPWPGVTASVTVKP